MIMAAQKQTLNPRAMEGGIDPTRPDPRCRLCRDGPEAGCERLAGTAQMERPNHVAGVAHRNICTNVGLETPS